MRAVIPDDLDHLPALPDDEDLVPSPAVKRENGGISDMTLWRWTRNPRIQFPQPDLIINGRKYWKRKTLRHRDANRGQLEGKTQMHRPISKFEVSKQPTRVMPERCLTPASSVAPAKQ